MIIALSRRTYADLWDLHKDRSIYTYTEILYEEQEIKELVVPETIKRLFAVHYAQVKQLVDVTKDINLEAVQYPWRYHSKTFLNTHQEELAKATKIKPVESLTTVVLCDGVKIKCSRYRFSCLGGFIQFDERDWRYVMNADEQQVILCIK